MRATLTDSVLVVRRPMNSSIVFGGLPAACRRVGDGTNVAMMFLSDGRADTRELARRKRAMPEAYSAAPSTQPGKAGEAELMKVTVPGNAQVLAWRTTKISPSLDPARPDSCATPRWSIVKRPHGPHTGVVVAEIGKTLEAECRADAVR